MANGILKSLSVINNQPQANQWIPVSEKLPPQPKPNPVIDNRPIEIYLVTVKNGDYPIRAFWNGNSFTDGWGKVNVIAWQPLPEKYTEVSE